MALCLPGAASAQNVLLHEVFADAGDQWIELHNRSAASIDLSSWSLHYNSHTAGLPQTYWWAFPANTTIAPGGFLRVHWDAPIPATAIPGELFTGNTPYHFLFGLGTEPLSGTRGALGLLRSQQNTEMNSSSIFEDWVSWGAHDFAREYLAVEAGVWSAGRQAPSIPQGNSLARDTAAVGTLATRDLEWFADNTPTPGLPNVTGASVQSYGAACALPGNHLLGMPLLHTTSMPLLGNAQFAFSIEATTGIYGEFAFIAFSAGARPAGLPSLLPPYAGIGCQEAIDTSLLVGTWLLPTQLLSTPVPLSLANQPPALIGAVLHAQAMLLDLLPNSFPPYQGLTNALRVQIGQ